MPRPHSFRLASAAALLFAGLSSLPARAANKDMIQLQTQIQQLQDTVARLQQSNDESMGVLKDLVQQTADSMNRMSTTIDGLKLQMQNEQDALGAKSDQVAGQIQSLNDSLDELKARMDHLQKSLTDMQGQQQSMSAIIGNLPQASGAPAASAPPATAAPATTAPAGVPASEVPDQGQPLPAPATAAPPAADQPAPVVGPSSADLYRSAYSDYISARYPLATSEFQQLIQAYPDDNLSGNAYFYIGEMDMRSAKPSAAVKSYDRLLEHYPDNVKIPAAELHKAEALISMKQDEAAIRELRALIQRFPISPEAVQARSKLTALGARR